MILYDAIWRKWWIWLNLMHLLLIERLNQLVILLVSTALWIRDIVTQLSPLTPPIHCHCHRPPKGLTGLYLEAAIQDELKSLEAFNTFEVVDLPPGKKPVGCKYVFKTKYKPNGDIEKYEVRLVAQ